MIGQSDKTKILLSAWLLLVALHLNISALQAQGEANNWYFGNMAGMTFSSNPPTKLTNSGMVTSEGCATISDASGNLLFYTDGKMVYNRQHAVMTNGNGLRGHSSSTQSGIIVRKPGSQNLYYIFTQAEKAGADGLRYSVVDMTQSGGMGAVITKNIVMHTPSCEKIAAVYHANGTDFWLVSHDYGNNNFRAYLLTSAGINAVPVISQAGDVINDTTNTIGQLKFSPDGTRLGLAVYNYYDPVSSYELYSFNKTTGVVSNRILKYNSAGAYGCEFSGDGTKFYGCGFDKLYQWDLTAWNSTLINASRVLLDSGKKIESWALQRAPNGKIYMAFTNNTGGQDTSLSIIHQPNLSGASCQFQFAGFSVAPNNVQLGLPNFNASYVAGSQPPITHNRDCNVVTFNAGYVLPNRVSPVATGSLLPFTGILWNFDDPASGAANTSTLMTATHAFSGAGVYYVKRLLFYQNLTDTSIQKITIANATPPVVTVSGPYSVCSTDARPFSAAGAAFYKWSNGATGSTALLNAQTTGTYSVTGMDADGCKSTTVFTVLVSACVGLDDYDHSTNLKIWPNPFDEVIHLDVTEAGALTICDPQGKVVFTKFIESGTHKFDTNGLQSGVYVLKLVQKSGVKFARLVKRN